MRERWGMQCKVVHYVKSLQMVIKCKSYHFEHKSHITFTEYASHQISSHYMHCQKGSSLIKSVDLYCVICTPSPQAIPSLIMHGPCFPVGSFTICFSNICLLTVSESPFVVEPLSFNPSLHFHHVTVTSL